MIFDENLIRLDFGTRIKKKLNIKLNFKNLKWDNGKYVWLKDVSMETLLYINEKERRVTYFHTGSFAWILNDKEGSVYTVADIMNSYLTKEVKY